MKTLSITISESEYEVFRKAAQAQQRSVAYLIRQAMARYREEQLQDRTPLTELPVITGVESMGELPSRADVYNDVFAEPME